jgi:hypothetical protein
MDVLVSITHEASKVRLCPFQFADLLAHDHAQGPKADKFFVGIRSIAILPEPGYGFSNAARR